MFIASSLDFTKCELGEVLGISPSSGDLSNDRQFYKHHVPNGTLRRLKKTFAESRGKPKRMSV